MSVCVRVCVRSGLRGSKKTLCAPLLDVFRLEGETKECDEWPLYPGGDGEEGERGGSPQVDPEHTHTHTHTHTHR